MKTRAIRIKPFLNRISPRSHWKEIVGVSMLLLAFLFFKSERKELASIIPQLQTASAFWIFAGVIVSAGIVYFQAGMYKKTFASVGLKLPWIPALILFLKRNFLSVFLPAGGVTSLAYLPPQIRRMGFKQSDILQASGLYAFAGLLTVFLAGLPVVIFTIFNTTAFKESWVGLLAVVLVILFLYWIIRAIRTKGFVFIKLQKHFPALTPVLEKMTSATVSKKAFSGAVTFSLGVELAGMLAVYVSMYAIGAKASFGAAAAVYIIAVIMMVVSPFLRGLGAVEMSMTFALTQFGYSSAEALSITILYRIFEFWMPLIAGFISFIWKGRQFILRAAPVVLIFFVGIINIVSVLTPPLQMRLKLLREYLPWNAIHASNLLVLFSGIALLVTSLYLIRGLRNAWTVAVVVTTISLLGNLTKALDYEEATFCFITLLVLLGTARQYKLKGSSNKARKGIVTTASVFAGVTAVGFLGFYFINPDHFGIDFTWQQALLHTLKSFLLVEDASIVPVTRFGNEFVLILRTLGLFTWIYLLIMIVRTDKNPIASNDDRSKAENILEEYGSSALDYFKLSSDKLLFYSNVSDSFVSYKIARNVAVVLEGPVGPVDDAPAVLGEFQQFCYQKGLMPVYYRVSEQMLPYFEALRKKKIIIGQEAILDAENFSLEGKNRKSLRNGMNSLKKSGFLSEIRYAPHNEKFLQELKTVSDDWLQEYEKSESVFSQGMFDPNELQNQDVIILEDANNKVVAFLNVIPDYAQDECTYDLIRKTKDAPGAAMDALVIKLIEYTKIKGGHFINMGLVPFAVPVGKGNTAEELMKTAFEKIKLFEHFRGLRQFKEKYASVWENKYLVYENDFDLLQFPLALSHVMKPGEIKPSID